MKTNIKRTAVIVTSALSLALSGLAFAAKTPPPPKGPAKSPPTRGHGPVANAATLVASASGDATANLYVPFQWDVAVTNTGSAPTTGEVTVSDVIPAGIHIEYISNGDVVPGTAQFNCSFTGQNVFCSTTDPLPVSGTPVQVVTVYAYATSGVSVTNSATVNWSSGASISPTWTTALTDTLVRNAKVRARAGGDTMATAGTPFTWSMALINIGDAPSSTTLSVTDDIDPSLTINSIAEAPGVACSQNGQLVTCVTNNAIPPMIGDEYLPDSPIATISLTARAPAAASVGHQVVASWTLPGTGGSSTSYPWYTAYQ